MIRLTRLALLTAVAIGSSIAGPHSAADVPGPAGWSAAAATQAPPQGGRGGGPQPFDEARARELYVSNRPEDHPPANYQAQLDTRLAEEARYPDACRAAAMECRKVTYRSSVGDMDIPAYLFAPLEKRGSRGHAAMIWVHGGVHGRWTISYFPFVREAVSQGYVVIAPEYRGSIGYGEAHHRAIDYGGKEVDDTMSAVDFLRTLAYVDPDRLGIMGWSHGGYIALLSVFRASHPFKAAAAIVPVSNLIFRLSYKGPRYQRSFATQEAVQGLPFERRDLYVARSPVFHVDKLQVPLLVHVATNDTDVNFVEAQQLVDALQARKPDLSETRVYVDPTPGPTSRGHTFSRRTNTETLERDDSPEQIDSWNRVWTFFRWNLK
ncbi:MAG TPA: alpha/beta fold hydrolase [Vicinamibacterales bacterium]|nr:alpha/beta fold hydrolase [Vicinamibacterales bacterium]